jgi:hypothetical protein
MGSELDTIVAFDREDPCVIFIACPCTMSHDEMASEVKKVVSTGAVPLAVFRRNDVGLPVSEEAWEEFSIRGLALMTRCDAVYLADNYDRDRSGRIVKRVAEERSVPVFSTISDLRLWMEMSKEGRWGYNKPPLDYEEEGEE